MNPFLIVVVLIGAILLWFLLAFAYKPIGTLFTKIFNDSMKAMESEEEHEETK